MEGGKVSLIIRPTIVTPKTGFHGDTGQNELVLAVETIRKTGNRQAYEPQKVDL